MKVALGRKQGREGHQSEKRREEKRREEKRREEKRREEKRREEKRREEKRREEHLFQPAWVISSAVSNVIGNETFAKTAIFAKAKRPVR